MRVELPFGTLLGIALWGKLTGKFFREGESVLSLNGHETEIIERIILDKELRDEITASWERAGYTPEEGSSFQLTLKSLTRLRVFVQKPQHFASFLAIPETLRV